MTKLFLFGSYDTLYSYMYYKYEYMTLWILNLLRKQGRSMREVRGRARPPIFEIFILKAKNSNVSNGV